MTILTIRNPQYDLRIDGERVIIGDVKRKFSDFIERIETEVKSKPKSVQKRFYKILKSTYLSAIPLLVASKAHADYPLLDSKYESKLLPVEITEILKELILVAGSLGILFAMLCLMAAGIYRIIGQRSRAQSWSKDIIGGLGQILLAPVIILILVTLTNLIFGNVGLDIFF